jgi:very-short-patch-repair endonuclease
MLEDLRWGPLAERPDLEVGLALTRLLYEDFTAYGTGGGERLDDESVMLAIKTHRAVLERLRMEPPRLPFRNFSAFGDYWRRNGMSGGGGWAARRECVESLLGPTRDALEQLEEAEYEAQFSKRPTGRFKNLIFAADGPKPKIVLRDAVNNDVEIVSNADNCLVFNGPLSLHGLTWAEMVGWWADRQQTAPNDRRTAHALYARLAASLDSEPERLMFRTYCARYGQAGGDELPALIPQVYLHYDPYTRRTSGHTSALARQRMDFLLLTPDRSRIVIEVDGVQHYADATGKASTRLYSEMVAEDRRLRLMGYDIYRFGGHELARPDASTMLQAFFDELLSRHKRPSA